jgi:hypothetical protein
MKRFAIPVLLMAVLLLSGCVTKQGPKFGALEVTIENQTEGEKSWTALVKIKNPGEEAQVLQFADGPFYAMIVSKGNTEVYRGNYTPQNQSDLQNLMSGAEKSFAMGWSYTDQAGNRVQPGTYKVRVELYAATNRAAGPKVVGPVDVLVK